MEVVIKKKVENVPTFEDLKDGDVFFAPKRTDGEQELLMVVHSFNDYLAVNLHSGDLVDMEYDDAVIPVTTAKIIVE